MDNLALTTKKQSIDIQARVLNFLTVTGHSVLPDYYSGKTLDIGLMKKAVFNAKAVRDLFKSENQIGVSVEERELAREYIRTEEFVYADGYRGARIQQFDRNDGEKSTYCRFASNQLPDAIQAAYDEETGIFSCQGLKVWLGYHKHAGDNSELEAEDTIIMAFAGTTMNVKQIEANIRQIVESSVIYLSAVGLASAVLALYPYHKAAFVGHSLGGGLAQFSLAAVISPANAVRLTGFCYNSAGLNHIAYENLSKKGTLPLAHKRTLQFCVEGEPVSMYFGLIGKVTILPLPADKKYSLLERHRLATVKLLL